MPESAAEPQSLTKKVIDGRAVQWFKAHPQISDGLLMAPLLLLALLPVVFGPAEPTATQRPFDLLAVVLMLGSIIPLAWRRRAPRLVLAANVVVIVPFLVLNYPDNVGGLASLLALYTVAVHCDRREATVALGWTAAVMIPLLTAGVFYSGEQLPVAIVFSNVIIFATAWLVGDAVRNRRILVEDLRFRAETAERQREDEAQQAVLDERARIAREMHDIVAHGMSVMIVQAGAARRVLAKHPDQAAEAMAVIEQTGRDAMVEMRRLLGVLRDESADAEHPSVPADAVGATAPVTARAGRPETGRPEVAPRAPQPGMEAVPALVQQWTTAGLEVTYEVVGELPRLSSGLDVSAYRLIQEALTNASKHAGPAHVRVTVQATDAGLDITVADDGYGAAAVPVPGRGHGLIGMQERVALFGGTVSAAPGQSGGYVVHAVLPLDSRAVPPAVGASRP